MQKRPPNTGKGPTEREKRANLRENDACFALYLRVTRNCLESYGILTPPIRRMVHTFRACTRLACPSVCALSFLEALRSHHCASGIRSCTGSFFLSLVDLLLYRNFKLGCLPLRFRIVSTFFVWLLLCLILSSSCSSFLSLLTLVPAATLSSRIRRTRLPQLL